MTCIILGQTLWQTVWVNVIDQESRDCDGNPATAGDSRRFPWMGTLRTSEGGRKTTPRDAHPDQAFWATPRRILLDFENALPGRCDLCGEETDHLVTQFQTKPYGVSYVGWVHPLSPYYRKDRSSTDLLPSHLQADGITYQNWLGTVINDRSKGVWVSQNVALFPGRTPPGKIRAIYSGYGGRPRLWVFGYDMDNKKPRCYYEGTMPIITAEGEWAASFEELAAGMVRAAGESAKNTQWCVKVALYDNPSDIQGGFSVIPARFYQATEDIFFQNLEEVASLLSKGKDLSDIRRMWLETLRNVSTQPFDEYSQSILSMRSTLKSVNARRLLLNPYSKSNRAIREHLGIPDQKKRKIVCETVTETTTKLEIPTGDHSCCDCLRETVNENHGDRAELRRCRSPAEVAFVPAFYRLKMMVPQNFDPEKLAAVAGILSHVEIERGGSQVGSLNFFARPMARPLYANHDFVVC